MAPRGPPGAPGRLPKDTSLAFLMSSGAQVWEPVETRAPPSRPVWGPHAAAGRCGPHGPLRWGPSSRGTRGPAVRPLRRAHRPQRSPSCSDIAGGPHGSSLGPVPAAPRETPRKYQLSPLRARGPATRSSGSWVPGRDGVHPPGPGGARPSQSPLCRCADGESLQEAKPGSGEWGEPSPGGCLRGRFLNAEIARFTPLRSVPAA